MNTIIHDLFIAELEIDDKANAIYGRVLNARSLLKFEGRSLAELRQAFADTIAEYRDRCRESGVDPIGPITDWSNQSGHQSTPVKSSDELESQLARRYKSAPTIDNYVKLRREFPDKNFEVKMIPKSDLIFSNYEMLENSGISIELFESALNADYFSISEISLLLLENIIEKSEAEREGKTHLVGRHLAISDSNINFITCLIFEAAKSKNVHVKRRSLK